MSISFEWHSHASEKLYGVIQDKQWDEQSTFLAPECWNMSVLSAFRDTCTEISVWLFYTWNICVYSFSFSILCSPPTGVGLTDQLAWHSKIWKLCVTPLQLKATHETPFLGLQRCYCVSSMHHSSLRTRFSWCVTCAIRLRQHLVKVRERWLFWWNIWSHCITSLASGQHWVLWNMLRVNILPRHNTSNRYVQHNYIFSLWW